MLNKIEYENNLDRLIQSIIIKVEEAAYQVQYFIHEQYGVNKPDIYLDDKKTWKYYLNLSGQYHYVDTPMYVYNRYTNSEMLLTVDTINSYPLVKAELLEFGLAYEIVAARYPMQENIIKSILLPVDIDVAIAADTGTILSYNKNMVDRKEYSLMLKVQDFVYGFFSRYYIADYALVDNLVIASVFAVLYPVLRLKIDNIRVENMLTYEAHDYYMGLFFKSHLGIDLELEILPDKVVMWLYKNLRYIERHTGKQKILDIIVNKILEHSNMGIGELKLIKEDVTLNEFSTIYEPSYNSGAINFKTEPLNKRYIVNKNKTYTLDQVIKKELLLPENVSLEAEVMLNNETINTAAMKLLTEKTKILEIDDKIVIRSRTIPELHIIIDNWFYYAFNNKYNYKTEISDVNTNRIYNVTAKQAALMLIKLFVKVVGQEDRKLKSFKTSSVLRYEDGLSTNINRLFLDRNVTDELTNAIFNNIPTLPDSFTSMEQMQNYLLEVNDLNNLIWYSISNAGNAVISSTLKRLQDRIYEDKNLDLTIYGAEATIDSKLEFEGVDFVVGDNYDYMAMIKLLVKTFTGLGFNTTDEDTADIEKYISLIKKITSYSIQIIYTPVTSSSIESPYTAEEIIMLSKPLISCTKATFKPLEDFYGLMNSKEFKWIDSLENEVAPAEVTKPMCDGMFGFNYFIDRNYYRSNNTISVSMSQDFKCIYAYGVDIEAEATVAKKTYMETYVEELDWISEDLQTAYSSMSMPTISDSKLMEPSVDMSIDARDVDLNTTAMEVNAFNHTPGIVDVLVEQEMKITYAVSENELAVLNKDFSVVDNLRDLININMSVDLSNVELINYQEIEDVMLFTGQGIIIKDSITIMDYEYNELANALLDSNGNLIQDDDGKYIVHKSIDK